MSKRKHISICIAFLLIYCSGMLHAQEEYKMEIGIQGGGSFYMGDANPTKFFKNTEAAFGALWRYNINTRMAVKVNLGKGTLSGQTLGAGNIFPDSLNVSFKKNVFDLSGRYEYNFNGYGYRLRGTSRFTPYIFGGAGFTLATGEGSTAFTINIPFGVGVKYKFAPRFNLGGEFSMHKTFSDNLDNVKGAELILNDPYKIKSSIFKNKDWYSFMMIYISYDFHQKLRNCNSM